MRKTATSQMSSRIASGVARRPRLDPMLWELRGRVKLRIPAGRSRRAGERSDTFAGKGGT
jgi:hypothetical protein